MVTPVESGCKKLVSVLLEFPLYLPHCIFSPIHDYAWGQRVKGRLSRESCHEHDGDQHDQRTRG